MNMLDHTHSLTHDLVNVQVRTQKEQWVKPLVLTNMRMWVQI